MLIVLVHNFKRVDADEQYEFYDSKYDYNSLMHYTKQSFMKDKNDIYNYSSIESKFDPNKKLGNSHMSETDIEELNKLYQCHGKFLSG